MLKAFLVDWVDFFKLHHFELESCPLTELYLTGKSSRDCLWGQDNLRRSESQRGLQILGGRHLPLPQHCGWIHAAFKTLKSLQLKWPVSRDSNENWGKNPVDIILDFFSLTRGLVLHLKLCGWHFSAFAVFFQRHCSPGRVSFKASFDSKQLKLKLSETKCLFRLFRFNRNNRRPTETVWYGAYFAIFYRKFRVFPFFWFFFLIFIRFFSVCFEAVCFGCFTSIPKQRVFDVSIEPKQLEDPPKQFERKYMWVIFRKFRVVSVCYKTVLFVSVVSILVRNTETNRNFFLVSRNKPKQTRNRSCFGLFRFEPKFIFVCFVDTLSPG